MNFTDEELTVMFNEHDEDAKDVLYEKYSYIVDIIMQKYKKSIYALGLEFDEVKQDAMVAFSDALRKYSDGKESSLPTFISVVVERKIQNCIRSAVTIKNKVHNGSISLEADYETFSRPLEEIIGDNRDNPEYRMENKENYDELKHKIDNILSPFEKKVYKLVVEDMNYNDIAKYLNKEPKQIDNTIQRIRNKIKDIL